MASTHEDMIRQLNDMLGKPSKPKNSVERYARLAGNLGIKILLTGLLVVGLAGLGTLFVNTLADLGFIGFRVNIVQAFFLLAFPITMVAMAPLNIAVRIRA